MTEPKKELYKYVQDYFWEKFRRNTAILSATCRQLALGLGGVGWAFLSKPHQVGFAKTILLSIVLFFVADAAQYLFQGYTFQKLALDYDDKIANGEISEIAKLVEKPKMNWPTHLFFIFKLVMLAFAAIFFIAALIG